MLSSIAKDKSSFWYANIVIVVYSLAGSLMTCRAIGKGTYGFTPNLKFLRQKSITL